MLKRRWSGPNSRLRLVGRAGEGGAVGDVERDAVRLDAASAQFVERRVDRLGPDVGDGDPAARAAEDFRLAEPRAGGAAGDEGMLAAEILHLNSPR